MKVFCLGPAGAGASMFSPWTDVSDLKLSPVCLPGREDRILEEPLNDIRQVATWVVEHYLGGAGPYVLFGQCMGALVAYETTRILRAAGRCLPGMVFLSGHRAPHLPQIEPRISQLQDEDFLRNVKELGGTPDECFDNEELLELVMPALRADFTACDNYVFESGEPLSTPIVVFGADDDPYVSQSALEAWRGYTTSSCYIEHFAGDHFFYLTDQRSLVQSIQRHILSQEAFR